MSCTRYVNSSPTWSLLPWTSSPHHPRTSLIASKTRSGVWSTTNEAVKSFTIVISLYLHGACLTESRILQARALSSGFVDQRLADAAIASVTTTTVFPAIFLSAIEIPLCREIQRSCLRADALDFRACADLCEAMTSPLQIVHLELHTPDA